MGRITDDMETGHIGGSNFNYTGVGIGRLGASEYTLVDIVVDTTGSTSDFADELRQMLIAAVDSCRKSPRSENLLIRVTQFNNDIPGGIEELHGYKPLSDIDTTQYPVFDPNGSTNLSDAFYQAVGAQEAYGEKLYDSEYYANGIIFVITDGDDNRSTTTPGMSANKLADIKRKEKLESIVTILIGVNAQFYQSTLQTFQKKAGIDKYIDAGEATKGKLAKLADFVSQSVSSQSQAMGTGGPSQDIDDTI